NTPADERYAALDRRRAKHRDNAPMELVGGVRILALQTTPLPPATHTNCYIVGDERFVIIDPGSDEPSQAALVESAVDELRRQGKHLEAVVLTHHHPDHIGGAAGLVHSYSAPVWAHAQTAERVDLHVDRRLVDGEVIDLGDDSLTCLHTPGHAPGHLCLHHKRSDSILAGDLVASKGTIIINPPNGHLGDYMNSLERVRSLQPPTIFPAHGWAITRPKEVLDYYIEHRRERDRQLLEALQSTDEPATPEDLVPQVYEDVPEHVWPLAARSLLAHLLHMVEQGRAATDGERFWIE
ncbi:MAG: MBL fold metallo-hydrolase, partial [Persicimonas sp.]